jgi:hypothetical protein
MKISTADKYFSECVREANNHTCEWCGKQGRMETSHVFSRRHRTIRWDKLNATCMCHACHRKWHESPLSAFAWFESKFGQGRIDLLREKMNAKIKVSKLEEKEIARYYREELKKLNEKRLNGEPLDFESWQ